MPPATELGFTEPSWKEGSKFNFFLGPILRASDILMFAAGLGRVIPRAASVAASQAVSMEADPLP